MKKNKHEKNDRVQNAKSVKKNGNSDIRIVDSSNTNDGRNNILIEDVVLDVSLGDYGSDLNAMPDTTFKKVVAAVENFP